MNGTPHVPSLEAARPGLKIIAEVGVESHPREIETPDSPPDRTGGETGLASEHSARSRTSAEAPSPSTCPTPQEVCRELLKREILVDWRPKAGVRMSPHFYNTDQELETAISAVEEILKERAVAVR